MARPASYEEIAQLLGGADEPTIDRIREIGASASEIAEAVRRARSGPQLDAPPPPASEPRIAEVRAILEERAAPPYEDDDLRFYEESITSD